VTDEFDCVPRRPSVVRGHIVGEVVSKYGPIENYPHLIVISGTEIKKYDGGFSAEPLKNYFSEFSVGIPEAVAPEPVKPKKPERPKAATVWTKTSFDAINESCKKSLCVIAFVNENDENNEILTQCIEKFKNEKAALVFLIASLDDEPLKSKFGVTQSSLVVYNAKKNRVARATSFTTDSIYTFLERGLTGQFNYEQLE